METVFIEEEGLKMDEWKRLGRWAVFLVVTAVLNGPVLAGNPSDATSHSGKNRETTMQADNFYKSNEVTVQKVTFPNQYKMTVTGNLFLPKNKDQPARP